MQNYLNKNLIEPHLTTNISIVFFDPQSPHKKFNNKIYNRNEKDDIIEFKVTSYSYKLNKINDSDIELIYSNILLYLMDPTIAMYSDPLVNNKNKAAKQETKISNITVKPKWVCDALKNYYKRYLLGDSINYSSYNYKLHLYENIMSHISTVIKRHLYIE